MFDGVRSAIDDPLQRRNRIHQRFVLGIAFITSLGFLFLANAQRTRAQAQTQIAERQTKLAEVASRDAEAQKRIAETKAEEARREAGPRDPAGLQLPFRRRVLDDTPATGR